MYNEITAILDKYLDKEGRYSPYREAENTQESYSIDQEIENYFTGKKTQYNVEKIYCFESPGYECGVLAVSWIDDTYDNLGSINILWEIY